MLGRMEEPASEAHPPLVWKPVNAANWRDAYALEPREHQRTYVAPNGYSLLEGVYTPKLASLLAYEAEVPVGYALYGDDPDEPGSDPVWLIRFMVAGQHQGRGLGRRALEALLARIGGEQPGRPIRLGVVEDNDVARRLYRQVGFVEIGEMQGREVIYERAAP